MTRIYNLIDMIFAPLDRFGDAVLTTAARLVFAGVLLVYYIRSGLTKLGDGITGIFLPSDGAYIQIFPKAVEGFGYDFSQLGVFHWAVVTAGTWAEFILPVAILLGLLTRPAALGMIGFIIVQSWVDITGHGLGSKDIGTWFDGNASALIVDQRAFWVFLLAYMMVKGAGPLSLDALLKRR